MGIQASTPAATPSYSDDAHGLWAKIEHKAARALKPGVYYVKIQEYANNGTIGSYTVKLTCTPATQPVAVPTFNPASPYIFASSTTVAISCATKGATIRYTTNGSTPKSNSTVYKNPLTFSSTTTLKAAAFKSGMGNSDVATGYYCLNTDPYEPDDTGATAKTIVSGETQRHNGSPAHANDWLAFTVKENSTVTINLDESSRYSVDLFLYDAPTGYWGDQVTYSYSGRISTGLTPGTYYLRCYPWYTAVQSYFVSLAIAPN